MTPSKQEYSFNKLLRDKLEPFGISFWRVENHGDPGMPDNHFVSRGGLSGWMELKDSVTIPIRIAYEKNQPAWHLDYWRRGGFCCTIIRIQEDNLMWLILGKDTLVAATQMINANHFTYPITEEGWTSLAASLLRMVHLHREGCAQMEAQKLTPAV